MLRIACILSLIALCYSCESVVELDDIYTKPTLSASSIFTSEIVSDVLPYEKGNTFEVQLTQSRSVTSEKDFVTINDAIVEVYDDQGLLETLEFNAASRPKYEGIQLAQAGKKYTLKVHHPDFLTLEATSMIPNPASIGSTTPISKTGEPSNIIPNVSIEKIQLEIELNDPPEKNYYHVLFYNNLVNYTVQGLDTVLNWQNANNLSLIHI